MWETFWPDVIVAAIGAGLTVVIAITAFALRVLSNEKDALQLLLNDLHRRRALSISCPRRLFAARFRNTFRFASASVVRLRDEIRDTRIRTRKIERLQEPLAKMMRACNRYLEQIEISPDHYQCYLVKLREELDAEVRSLVDSRRGLTYLRPGGNAF